MARTTKKYGGVDYIADDDFDYTTAIGEAAAHGDYDYAASLERSRNAKIDGEGLSYAKTYKYQNGTSPTYKSKYGGKIDKTLSAIMNRKPFEYDYTKDDSYKALEEVYTQNGKYAMQDTLGDAAALTGGKASTAAVSASQQAYNRYMSELSANIPALEQAAYGRYRDEENSLYNQLGVYQQMDDIDYGRHQDSWNRDHMLGREAVDDARYNDETAYARGRDALADKRYDDEIAYRNERDAIEDARYNDETAYGRDIDSISRLMDIAQATGDYSVLRDNPEIADKYGFTEEVVTALNEAHAKGVSEREIEKAFEKAQYMAMFGDFSGFKDAGFTDAQIAKMEEYWKKGELREDALFAAQFGDYSKLSALGITPYGQDTEYTPPVTNPTVNRYIKIPTDPAVDDPVVDDPEVDDPEVDAPTVNDPAVDDPAVDDPAINDPAVDDPAVDDPAVDDPAVDDPETDEDDTAIGMLVYKNFPKTTIQYTDPNLPYGIMTQPIAGAGWVGPYTEPPERLEPEEEPEVIKPKVDDKPKKVDDKSADENNESYDPRNDTRDVPDQRQMHIDVRETLDAILKEDGYDAAKEALDEAKKKGLLAMSGHDYNTLLRRLQTQRTD